MTVLVVGANGATGQWLVRQLLDRGASVRAVVRDPGRLAKDPRDHRCLSLIGASVLDLTDRELAWHVQGCDAVASCLGHNLTFKGAFGQPRMLVSHATRRLCDAVKSTSPREPVRFVPMNTAGNSNRDLPERVGVAEKFVIALLRAVLPPHLDNEPAADCLRTSIGQNDPRVESAVVRPDTLIDEDRVSEYDVHESPTRSAIFNAGRTSRINAAHFMADLLTDDCLWSYWNGRMPVIYNRSAN